MTFAAVVWPAEMAFKVEIKSDGAVMCVLQCYNRMAKQIPGEMIHSGCEGNQSQTGLFKVLSVKFLAGDQ